MMKRKRAVKTVLFSNGLVGLNMVKWLQYERFYINWEFL